METILRKEKEKGGGGKGGKGGEREGNEPEGGTKGEN